MSEAKRIDSIQEATGALMTSLEGLKSRQEGGSEEEEVDNFEFSNKDAILYALGGTYVFLFLCRF